jgi:hypothetical protein
LPVVSLRNMLGPRIPGPLPLAGLGDEGRPRTGTEEMGGRMVERDTKVNSPPERRGELLATLEERFELNGVRHQGIRWESVGSRLAERPDRLWSLGEMERTGGEPDVVGRDMESGEYLFYDCSVESPSGRRSLCYDAEARAARKKHKPVDSAVSVATAMGAVLLTEDEYRVLQRLGEFDTRTSSWLLTPPDLRERGGAIFGDRRYGRVFVYHNGAESYYAARGFRCVVRV